jgi:hypothetical protein
MYNLSPQGKGVMETFWLVGHSRDGGGGPSVPVAIGGGGGMPGRSNVALVGGGIGGGGGDEEEVRNRKPMNDDMGMYSRMVVEQQQGKQLPEGSIAAAAAKSNLHRRGGK